MSFLNHGKPKPKEVPTNSQRSARKRDKAADSEAEISRFFASSKDQSHGDGVTMSNKDRGNLDNVTVERGRQQGGSSISPVDLPGKPFLGFGSCGPGHVSSLVPDNDVDQLSPLDQPLSSRSTTYFTWSQTNPSRHASSRHRTRSGRLSSETRLQLTPGLESTAGGRQRILSADVERNFGDESRARSSAYHPEIEHRGRGCDPAGPVSRPDRPFKASTERQQSRDDQKDHSKRQHKANEMSHPDSGLALQLSSPKPTLASLLATQIRPELLGEVLDALLARITNNGVRKDRDSRPSDTPHSKGLEGESVSEGIPKTQTQHDLNHPNAPNGPPFDWNVPNKPEVAERTYQACGSCCSQPLDRPSLRPSAQVASKASGLEPPIRDTDERLAASNARGTQGHSTDTQLNTQAATVRPGCSNAWTGYSSLYQGQMGPVNKRRQSCKDSLQDHALEDRQDKSYFFQTPAEAQDHDSASDGGGYDMFEENHRSDPHLDRRYLDAEDANRWNGTDLQIYDRMDPMHQQPQSKISENQDESYDRGCLIARNADLEAVTDVAPDQDLDDRVETLHGQDRPNFLGSRMLTMLDRNGSHSSWSHGSHQSSRRAPSARGGGVDTDMVGEASLSGFWKPNRLY